VQNGKKKAMGRPRKPSALKIVQGTAQKCRMNPLEPKPEHGNPDAPEGLGTRAAAYYQRICDLLSGMGVLTVADGLTVEHAANALADGDEARDQLAKPILTPTSYEVAAGGSLTYVTIGKSGPMVRNRPELALIADADRRAGFWLAKLGLTLADRSKVAVVKKEDSADPWARFG
jgi:P27 family predicted phage terminase small subunit